MQKRTVLYIASIERDKKSKLEKGFTTAESEYTGGCPTQDCPS